MRKFSVYLTLLSYLYSSRANSEVTLKWIDSFDFLSFLTSHAIPSIPAGLRNLTALDGFDSWLLDDSSIHNSPDKDELHKPLKNILYACFKLDTTESNLRLCPEATKRLIIPRVSVGDFLYQTISENASGWPMIKTLSKNMTGQIDSCPFGLHMLATVLDGELKAKVSRIYEKDSIPSNSVIMNGNVLYNEQLVQGDGLFLPSAYAMVISAVFDSILMLHCYVDASNLSLVKSVLRKESDTNTIAANILESILSPSFRYNMHRDVKGSTLDSLKNIHGPSKLPGNPGPNGRSRKSFRDWQDQSRWDHLILSLTLPTPTKPRVISTGRQTATLHWKSNFSTKEDDRTHITFELSWRIYNESLTFCSNHNGSTIVSYKDAVLDNVEKNIHSSNVINFEFSYTLEGSSLCPGSPYIFHVVLLYGESASSSSAPSEIAYTKPIESPSGLYLPPIVQSGAQMVSLTIKKPADNGGTPILAWHVIALVGNDVKTTISELQSWVMIGVFQALEVPEGVLHWEFDTITVKNLVPNLNYRFRVRAENAVGLSEWSAESDSVSPIRVTLGKSKIGRHRESIHGIHSKAQLSYLPDIAKWNSAHHPIPVVGVNSTERAILGKTVVLDDELSTIHVLHSNEILVTTAENFIEDLELQVWTGHFSPRKYLITAEVVLTRPFDASSALQNSVELRGRIALIKRGSVPLVKKILAAQRAGALGAIIVDNGSCKESVGFSQFCMPGSHPPEGWASQDLKEAWSAVQIPHVLMMENDAKFLIMLDNSVL